MAQRALQVKAATKLGALSSRLLLTADGLEQATRPEVARRHGDRWQQAGVGRVLDCGCGLGLDAVAVALAGVPVLAVDADEVTAAFAEANLASLAPPGPAVGATEVRHATAEEVLPARGPGDGAWFDPARRTAVRHTNGRAHRVSGGEAMSPPWSVVLDTARHALATGVKLSPTFARGEVPAEAEAVWTSFRGDVVECTVWWGSARVGRRLTATGLDRDGTTYEVSADAPGDAPVGESLGPWLYEVDRAALAAGLTGIVAEGTPLLDLGRGLGLLTGDSVGELPAARRWRVLASAPSPKRLRAVLRELSAGSVTLRRRGVPLDLSRLRRDLGLPDGPDAVVLAAPLAGRTTYLILEAG